MYVAYNITIHDYILNVMNWSFIKDLLSSDGGAAITIGAFIFSILTIFFKLGGITEKFRRHEKDIDEVKKNTDNIAEVKGNHRVFESRIDKVENKIDKIAESLTLLNVSISTITKSDPLTQTHSPLSLTQKGKELVENFGLKKMVDDNWQTINSCSNQIESKNPYDIQQFFIEKSILHLDEFIGDDNFNKIKLIAYNEGLTMASLSRAIAVIIRDRYFEEHNIEISEVDKHDPNKSPIF